MPDFVFHPDLAAIAGILDEPEVDDLLLEVGGMVADAARPRAPRRSGSGADSIHAEVHRGAPAEAFDPAYSPENDSEPIAYVSWDEAHYYMLFGEEGTEAEAPQPFLRPALEGVQI